jgi:hypothetical protein
VTYFDPGAGSLLIQAVGAILIGWVSNLGKVKQFFRRIFSRKKEGS